MSPPVPLLAALLVTLVAVRVVLSARARGARVLARRRVAGGAVAVRVRGGFRELVFEGERAMVHTRVACADDFRSGLPYTDVFHLGHAVAGGCERALFVGAGGAVVPRQFARLHPSAHLDVVELRGEVLDVAREHFGLCAGERLTLHTADGRAYLEGCDEARYDAVVLDAYGAFELPRHLATREFFALVRARLRPGGVLCANLLGAIEGEGTTPFDAVVRAARLVFGESAVEVVPVPLEGEGALAGDALRNMVLVAVNGRWPDPSAIEARVRAVPTDVLPALLPATRRLLRALRARAVEPLTD